MAQHAPVKPRTPRRWKLNAKERDHASILAIPWGILPDLHPAQLVLLGLIHTGHACRAVEREGAFFIVLDELGGRSIPLHVWKARYSELLEELAAALEVEATCTDC